MKENISNLKFRVYILLLLLTSGLSAQIFSGPTNVEAGSTHRYTVPYTVYDNFDIDIENGTLINVDAVFGDGSGPPVSMALRVQWSATASSGRLSCSVGSLNVELTQIIAQFNLTGGGGYCEGGVGVTVGLNGSQVGVSYQLKRNDNQFVGSPKTGTGYALDFGNQSTPGLYFVDASRDGSVKNMANTVSVTVYSTPSFSISNNGPVCEGTSLDLTGPSGMSSYSWSGPNGFISSQRSPTISTSATPSMSGTYTLIATNSSGCPNSSSTTVTVNPKPVFTTVPSGVSGCVGVSETLSASVAEATSYQWYWEGPNGSGKVPPISPPWSGNTSNVLTILNSTSVAGQYWLEATNSCGTVTSNTVTVSVSEPPVYTSNSGPVCEGETLSLSRTGGITGTYSWTGPNGFSSTSANPTVSSSATASMSGTYTLTVTSSSGCESRSTTTATVNAKPSFNVSNNGPVCEGASLSLTGPSGMSSYSWSGPNGFSSSQRSPTISTSATPSMSGTYTLIATNSSGCSSSKTTTVVVNPLPVISTQPVSNNVCIGNSVVLNTTVSGANSYRWHWSGSSFPDKVVPSTPVWTGVTTEDLTITAKSRSAEGQYWLMTSNSCGTRSSHVVTVNVTQAVVVVDNSGPICSGEALTLTHVGGLTGSYSWSGPNGFSSTQKNPTVSTNATTAMSGTYTLTVTSSSGCESSSITRATVHPTPSFSISNNGPVCEGTSLDLTGPSGMGSYSWSGPNGFSSTERSPTVSSSAKPSMAGTYTLIATNSNGCENTATSDADVFPAFECVNMNRIIEQVYKVEGVDSLEAQSFLNEYERVVNIQYFDGLGRPMQNVGWRQSPTHQDIVQPIVYDELGRQSKAYLPYSGGSGGGYQPNAIDPLTYTNSDQYAFYQNTSNDVVVGASPYAETKFEPSPLNRVKEQGAPGQPWQIGGGHTVDSDWRTNSSSEVILYNLSGNDLVDDGFYEEDELWVTSTTDEEENVVLEYTDKLGQVVLKDVEGHQTYYVYDDFGQLRWVLPPRNSASSTPLDSDTLDVFAFSYQYDEYGRMITKNVPGAAPVLMVYDRWDRLVLTQDGNQYDDDQWTYTAYDAFNRPVITGFLEDSRSHSAIQDHVMGLIERALVYSTAAHGYGNEAYPFKNIGAGASLGQKLTETYYDDYDFLNQAGYTAEFDYVPVNEVGLFTEDRSTAVKGQVTGSKTNILGTDDLMLGVMYYDDKYRVIQSTMHNDDRSITRSSSQYDFTGKVLKTYTDHLGGDFTEALTEIYRYDHADRLLDVVHRVGNAAPVTIASNRYNEIGQLKEKNLHSTDIPSFVNESDNSMYGSRIEVSEYNDEKKFVAGESILFTAGFTANAADGGSMHAYVSQDELIQAVQSNEGRSYLQSIDYQYNIRGWLSKLNESDLSTDGTAEHGSVDHFGMELMYDNAGSYAQYNGNIGQMAWKTSIDADNLQYGYTYDKLNRILEANYGENGTFASNKFDVTGFSYDANGNILGLNRRGVNDSEVNTIIDQLSYTYAGNQLIKVEDGNETAGFRNGVDLDKEYGYDANGNMVKDLNKGIDTILYNHLNLPVQVEMDTITIYYTYDAAGVKLKKVTETPSGTKETRYQGPMVFEDGVLQLVQHAEGRVLPDGDDWEYQYHLKDHLGNVRLTLTSKRETYTYLATMETEMSTTEEQLFGNVALTRQTDVLYDYTHLVHGFGNESARLNTADGKVVGPTLSLYVNAGDTIRTRVLAKYTGIPASTGTPVVIADEVTTGFGLMAAGETQAAYQAVNSLLGSGTAFLGFSSDQDVPRAYLTYHFFNLHHEYVTSGFAQVTQAADGGFEELTLELQADQQGYMYIYVGNETLDDFNVFFDDLQVDHSYTPIVQKDDYYPFGLTFNSYAVAPENKYKFQGQEHQDETGWDSFKWRNHQPDIGRFFNIDPLAEDYYYNSPYAFSENKVVAHVELEGLEATPFGSAMAASRNQVTEKHVRESGTPEQKQELRNSQIIAAVFVNLPAIPALLAEFGFFGAANATADGVATYDAASSYNDGQDSDSPSETPRKRRFSTKDRNEGYEKSKDENGVPRCEYCGDELQKESGSGNSYEADHRDSYKNGGESTQDNLAPACRDCNREKGSKNADEYDSSKKSNGG